MKAFIENEAGSNKKNIFNEKTFEYKKTYIVSCAYPFPYGFIPNTTSGDGDCLDCFILTEKHLKPGDVIEAEPIGLMEQIEDGEEDHKILAVLPGEYTKVTDDIKEKLTDFVTHVFDYLEGKRIEVGRFLGKDDADALANEAMDRGF